MIAKFSTSFVGLGGIQVMGIIPDSDAQIIVAVCTLITQVVILVRTGRKSTDKKDSNNQNPIS